MKIKFYLTATYLSCVVLGMFIACDKNDVVSDNISDETKKSLISGDEGYQRRMYVAKTLAKALTNEDLRSFLKKESLKMFDHEYDILYALVKDKEISSGVTFEDVLMSYAESKEHFKNAIDKELLLTIYVPELTNWDANKWNTAEEVPIVAVCDEYKKKKTTKVLAFDKMETPSYWDYNIEPDVPILVVKDNERVVINNEENSLRSASEDGEDLHILSTSKGNLEFSSEAFKNDNKQITTRSRVIIGKDFAEYPLNRGEFCGYWRESINEAKEKTPESQRDYIYYGISPKNNINKGTFKEGINECIEAFYIDNPQSIGYIVDSQRDRNNPRNWIEGRLEFFINIFFTGRDGKITNVRKGFTCKVSDLFGYMKNGELVSYCYFINNDAIKIVPWDMNKYGDTWKIHIYEFDPGSQITKTVQVSSTFSSNFEVDASVSVKAFKIGVKGGVGTSETKTNTAQITLTDTSDDLGEAILSFSDPIMIKNSFYLPDDPSIYLSYYSGVSTGLASVQISPQ